MNVLVLSNAAPFIHGGAEELAANLVVNLQTKKGVHAELLRIPFRWDPPEQIVQEMLLNLNLRLVNVDRVIAMKFPAYLVPHDNKILWLMHQYRQAYDLDRAGMTNLPQSLTGSQIRSAIRNADKKCFAEAKRIFTISPIVSDRLRKFNSFESEVLHHPLNDPEVFQPTDYLSYIFAGGRISEGKRQHLLIEAMHYTRSDIKLVIAGPAETNAYAARLRNLVTEYDLTRKVDLRFGFAPRSEIVDLINKARACASMPVDEDSMSYVAMESFAASKSVVTALDSGGLLEIVKDGETGYVVEPEAAAIAAAIDKLANPATAQMLGRAARAHWSKLDINWGSRIEQLLS